MQSLHLFQAICYNLLNLPSEIYLLASLWKMNFFFGIFKDQMPSKVHFCSLDSFSINIIIKFYIVCFVAFMNKPFLFPGLIFVFKISEYFNENFKNLKRQVSIVHSCWMNYWYKGLIGVYQ